MTAKRVPSALTWAANAQEAVRPRSPGRFAYVSVRPIPAAAANRLVLKVGWMLGVAMATKRPQGQYRTEPAGHRQQMAYVIDGFAASYITEAAYRMKGYRPDFDELPTEDEYNANP